MSALGYGLYMEVECGFPWLLFLLIVALCAAVVACVCVRRKKQRRRRYNRWADGADQLAPAPGTAR